MNNRNFLIQVFQILILISLVVSRILFFDTQGDWDEELYFLIAQNWEHHILPYNGIFDNKPPGVYAFYFITSGFGNYFGFVRVAVAAYLLLGCFAFISALEYIYESINENKVLLITCLYLIISHGSGIGANSELLYIPSLLLSSAFLIRQLPLASAVFAAFALSIKYTCMLDLFGLTLFYISVFGNNKDCWHKLLIWCTTSFIFTFLSYLFFYIYFKNNDIDLIHKIFLYNVQYSMDRFPFFSKTNGLFVFLNTFKPFVLLAIWLSWKTKTPKLQIITAVLWLSLSIGQGLITGKYFYHYFIPAAIPLVLLISVLKPKRYSNIVATLIAFYFSFLTFSSVLVERESYQELKNAIAPHCEKIKDGAYVLDNFLAAYRICEAKNIDRFVFSDFYTDPHYAVVANSGGLAALKSKIESGKIPEIIVDKNSKHYKQLLANDFHNIGLFDNPLTSSKEEAKAGPLKMIVITTFVIFKSIIFDAHHFFENGFALPMKNSAHTLDAAQSIIILLFCFCGYLAYTGFFAKNNYPQTYTLKTIQLTLSGLFGAIVFFIAYIWIVSIKTGQ